MMEYQKKVTEEVSNMINSSSKLSENFELEKKLIMRKDILRNEIMEIEEEIELSRANSGEKPGENEASDYVEDFLLLNDVLRQLSTRDEIDDEDGIFCSSLRTSFNTNKIITTKLGPADSTENISSETESVEHGLDRVTTEDETQENCDEAKLTKELESASREQDDTRDEVISETDAKLSKLHKDSVCLGMKLAKLTIDAVSPGGSRSDIDQLKNQLDNIQSEISLVEDNSTVRLNEIQFAFDRKLLSQRLLLAVKVKLLDEIRENPTVDLVENPLKFDV